MVSKSPFTAWNSFAAYIQKFSPPLQELSQPLQELPRPLQAFSRPFKSTFTAWIISSRPLESLLLPCEHCHQVGQVPSAIKSRAFQPNPHGFKLFSYVDFVRGHQQIPMAVDDITTTALMTPFEYLCRPLGLTSAAQSIQSLGVLFAHRRSPSWTTLVLYSRVVFFFNEPTNGEDRRRRQVSITPLPPTCRGQCEQSHVMT